MIQGFHKESIWKSMGTPYGFYTDGAPVAVTPVTPVAPVAAVAAVAVAPVAVAPVALCLQLI